MLFVTLFAGVADNQIIGPYLPVLAKAFQRAPGELGVVVSVYAVCAAGAALIAGGASDLRGRAGFLKAAMALFAAATLVTAHASSANIFILLRAVTGLAAGVISSCTIAYVADYFPYGARGRAMGIIMASYFAAATLGVAVLSVLADRFGWPAGYYVLAGLAALALGLLLTLLPKSAGAESPGLPGLGASRGSVKALLKPAPLAVFALAFLVSGGLVTFLTYIGAFLSQTYNRSTGEIGFIFLIGGLAAVVSAPLAGAAADRIGKRPLVIGSNVLLATSFALIPHLPWGWPLLAGFGAASLAAAVRQGPFEAFTTAVVGPQRRGLFVALRNLCSQLGIAASALTGGALYNQGGGFVPVALLCAGLTLAACLPVLVIKEPTKDGS